MSEILSYKISGGEPIVGHVSCMGAKNLVTKAMVAALLSEEPSMLYNVPHIGEVEITAGMIKSAGAVIEWSETGDMMIDSSMLSENKVSLPDSRTNRIPILLLSVLLQRFGEGIVPIVGGDNIGARNVDFHLHALKKFGVEIKYCDGNYVARRVAKLKGCHITLDYPSVGATETCLFLSVLAEGTSVIKNVAIEPEIIELIAMLCSMGAIIFMSSNREIIVHGVEKLHGTKFRIIGDRIEAASWASLACASNGRLVVSGIQLGVLSSFLSYYTMVGGGYSIVGADTIEFFRKRELSPITIETDVYPGFSTDWQQPFVMILTQAEGISVVHETVYEQRFGYLTVLNMLGADTRVVKGCLGSVACRYRGYDYDHSALIKGKTSLVAIDKQIEVPDIRAGLAYVIAAVLAEGETTLVNVEQIERGYGNLEIKLGGTNIKLQRSCIAV